MNTINHILSLPISADTVTLALICVGILAVRIGLSVILHKLPR